VADTTAPTAPAKASPTTTREAVLAAAQRMLADGLVEGTSGNISGRLPDGLVCLTPSSVPYDTMTLEDLVVVDLDGNVVEGTRGPTSEKDLHLSALRRYPDLGAVIHTHAVYATMFALAHEPIPAVIEEVVVYIGGDVPCCEYKGTGSKALGDEVAAHLGDRGAALLANHGLVTCGPSPEKALHNAALVERTAKIIWGARAMGATIHPLPEKVNRDMAGVYRYMRENP
jgi:L-fuculose-phosphate aldolase